MKNLKKLREEKGLTGEQLGKLVNVQKSAISKYERGDIQPSKEVLILLSKELNTSVDYLLGISDNPKPYEDLPKIQVGEGGKKIIIDLPENKADKLKKVIDVIFEDEGDSKKSRK